MVADIQLLQGQVIQSPESKKLHFSKLIQELALEILSEEDVAVAVPPEAQGAKDHASNSTEVSE